MKEVELVKEREEKEVNGEDDKKEFLLFIVCILNIRYIVIICFFYLNIRLYLYVRF